MRKLIAMACFLAVTPVFAGDALMFENTRVVRAAFREWGKSLGAGAQVKLSNDYMGMLLVGPIRLSNQLLKSGADRDRVRTLVDRLYDRNANVQKFAVLPSRKSDMRVRTFRATLPSYDDTWQHALVLGSPDDGWIYLALLAKVNKEEWRVTWTNRMELEEDAPSREPSSDGPPYRAGGDVKAPVAIRRVEPHYPADARDARVQGIVVLETVVNKEGRITSVNVLKPLPSGLSEAAVDAVRRWEFKPGTRNGEPVDVIFNLTLNFRLKDEPDE